MPTAIEHFRSMNTIPQVTQSSPSTGIPSGVSSRVTVGVCLAIAIAVIVFDLVIRLSPSVLSQMRFSEASTVPLIGLATLASSGAILCLTRFRNGESNQVADISAPPDVSGMRDSVTGLPNIGLMTEIYETTQKMANRSKRAMTVCILKIDDYAELAQIHGECFGTKVLQYAATIMQKSIRESDFIARISNDQFVIIDCLLSDAKSNLIMAKRLRTALAKPAVIAGEKIVLSASIGIAEYRPDDPATDLAALHADIALDRAVSQGNGSIVIYSPEMAA